MSVRERRIGFGVIGLGSYVARTAVMPALRRSPYAELVAVSTTGSERDDFPLRDGEVLYRSIDDLLDNGDVEAVYLPLPNDLHLPLILRSLEAGKHVLCEKPILLMPEHFHEIERSATRHGKIVTEAFMTAYHVRVLQVLEMASAGAFGDVLHVSSSFTGMLRPLSGYRIEAARGGGSLWDVGIYALYPVVELLGGVPIAIAKTVVEEFMPPVDMALSALLTYPAGRTGVIRTSFISGEMQRLVVEGSSAVVEVLRASTPSLADRTVTVTHVNGEAETLHFVPSDPYQSMVDAVSQAFIEGVEPRWTLQRSKEMTELVRAIRSS